MDVDSIPSIEDKAESREDRRCQLAEHIGRLLARQWVSGVLGKPMPGEDPIHPP